MELETKFGTFTAVDAGKLERVIVGSTNAGGEFVEGLGEDADPLEILAAYDRIGGLIRGKEGAKVKTGSFYDFKRKAPLKTPEIVYIFRVGGSNVEIADGEPIPLKVQAALAADEEVGEEEAKPKKRATRAK